MSKKPIQQLKVKRPSKSPIADAKLDDISYLKGVTMKGRDERANISTFLYSQILRCADALLFNSYVPRTDADGEEREPVQVSVDISMFPNISRGFFIDLSNRFAEIAENMNTIGDNGSVCDEELRGFLEQYFEDLRSPEEEEAEEAKIVPMSNAKIPSTPTLDEEEAEEDVDEEEWETEESEESEVAEPVESATE